MRKNFLLAVIITFLCVFTTTITAKADILQGEAEGFGGTVSVELVVKDGKIINATITGNNETPTVGGAAIPDLEKQVISANGPDIDGVSGATVTSTAVKKAVLKAMGAELTEENKEEIIAEKILPVEIVPIDGGIQIGQVYVVVHGSKCFTEAIAVIQDDTIIAAYIDDYQFLPKVNDIVGVPNSDNDFGKGYADGVVPMSKRANAKYYSSLMKKGAGATIPINLNFDAIQNFVVGKTIEEIEIASGKSNTVDAISGATLEDTANYLKAIAEAARMAKNTQAVEYKGDSSKLRLNVVLGTAHGTKCFTSAAAVTDGDRIILCWIDDFQFLPRVADVIGVPNSNSDFGKGYSNGVILASKRVNADYYSSLMRKGAGATIRIDANYNAIQAKLNGMKIIDAETLMKQDNIIDAVSGATLADTANYIKLVTELAKN